MTQVHDAGVLVYGLAEDLAGGNNPYVVKSGPCVAELLAWLDALDTFKASEYEPAGQTARACLEALP